MVKMISVVDVVSYGISRSIIISQNNTMEVDITGRTRRAISAGNKQKMSNSIIMQNQAKQLIRKLQKGQIVTILTGEEEIHETMIEQVNNSCIYVKLKGWMECINTADIITKRYEVWEV